MNTSWWNYDIFFIGNHSVNISHVLSALLIVVLTFVLSSLLRRGVTRLAQKRPKMSHAQVYVITRILHYIVLSIGFLVALSALGIDVSKLTLLASALGIGIGLGLQGIVNNFVSGIILLLEKTLKVGDFIELDSGVVGEVMEINMRATLIRTNDNVDILIPNAQLISGAVTNWTLEESIRRFRIPFGVAYGSDKNLVKKAVLEAADNVSYTLKTPGKEPLIWMTGFGDSSLNFILAVWVTAEQVKRPVGLTSDYLWAIDDALRKYHIEIPFPQRDLHIRSNEAQLGLQQPKPPHQD